jgi:ATP-dependent RNA helicase SUPV3L1/SUV3
MEPLPAALKADVPAPVRGIVFQLAENLGSIGRDAVAPQIEALGKAGRKDLRLLGVRLGRHRVYMPALAKAPAVAMRGLLWVVARGPGAPPPPPPPSWGRVSLPVAGDAPGGFYQAMGYVPFGSLAVRADIAERIASKAWALGRKGAFKATAELMSLAGCGAGGMAAILKGLGYRGRKDKGGVTRFRRASKPKPKKQETGRAVGSTGKQQEARKPRRKRVIQDSPFAKLGGLTAAPVK